MLRPGQQVQPHPHTLLFGGHHGLQIVAQRRQGSLSPQGGPQRATEKGLATLLEISLALQVEVATHLPAAAVGPGGGHAGLAVLDQQHGQIRRALQAAPARGSPRGRNNTGYHPPGRRARRSRVRRQGPAGVRSPDPAPRGHPAPPGWRRHHWSPPPGRHRRGCVSPGGCGRPAAGNPTRERSSSAARTIRLPPSVGRLGSIAAQADLPIGAWATGAGCRPDPGSASPWPARGSRRPADPAPPGAG